MTQTTDEKDVDAIIDKKNFEEKLALLRTLERQIEEDVFKVNVDSERMNEWHAQSTLFAMDIYNHLLSSHLLKNYRRIDNISLLDVGAGLCSGTNLYSSLHNNRGIWCKIDVTAIDYENSKEKFVRYKYPNLNYKIQDIYDCKDRFDIVVVSHVIEHVPQVEKFIKKCVDLANDICIFFAPYKEEEMIKAHINYIDESLFENYNVIFNKTFVSMGWHPAKQDKCILIGVSKNS